MDEHGRVVGFGCFVDDRLPREKHQMAQRHRDAVARIVAEQVVESGRG